MPDGTVFRAGILVLSSNTVVEDYCHDRLTEQGSLRVHFARISVTQISPDASSLSQFEETRMLAAFDLLAEAHPDRLVWGGTAAGWLGFDLDRRLCDRIEERTGIPATSSLLATNARLQELGARRIGLVTPYEQELETRIIKNYKAAGIDVVAHERLDITVNTDYANVPPAQIFEMSKNVAQSGAEAIVILCTNLAGAAIVKAASKVTGLPVLDSVEETFRPLVRLASETSTV
ncbi:MAG: maleate cis-trans isomerase family protein [Methyloligellaceae bacterium]